MIKVVLDCFGGDFSPNVNVEGAIKALDEFKDLYLILTGDNESIKNELAKYKYDSTRIEIVHAPEVITCNDIPTDAIRMKKESSLVKGIKILREEETVSSLVSIGSTGAIVASALLRIGRIKGVIRPAFCPVFCNMVGGIVGVCDSGANVDITAEHLRQNAIMGSSYLAAVYNIKNPRVALLNIGVEKEKGDSLRKEAYSLLENDESINFVGNLEARDFLEGKADLVVCDGFSGNVLLKATEGTAISLFKKLKKDINTKFIYKLGAALLLKVFKEQKNLLDYQNYGGSVLLGTVKTIVKGHGSSNGNAVYKCIEQAYRSKLNSLDETIENKLNKNKEG